MKRTVLACILSGVASVGLADSLPVTDNAAFTFNGQDIVITRSAGIDTTTITALTDVSSTCLSPCLSPMTIAQNVATLGELEVISFLSNTVDAGDGLLVDARAPNARSMGTIPTAVNIPAATLAPSNPFRDEILMALGAEQFQGTFDFSGAMALAVFDAGPATQDARTMINDLLQAGYPAEKIFYYRGGMQVWATLGLSIQEDAQ